jgi:hypothetical protein
VKEVIVTYSWDSEEHTQKVLSFTNWLREKGFDAHIDQMLAQEQTAIDFKKMMHQAMTDYKSVIIVISAGYKHKAESFTGGVGTEYSLVLKDIDDNPEKYILASFDGRGKDVTPLAFVDRAVVDLNTSKGARTVVQEALETPGIDLFACWILKTSIRSYADLGISGNLPRNFQNFYKKPAYQTRQFDVSRRHLQQSGFRCLCQNSQ